ncbi:Methylmalonyl-CoA mutase [Posidoniimonas polymericola]|uniref:Methylmalonyl-CoA mutase n=1 Tax=Posidoniimonas polymericola TaxID=2528002 RepID=A0A5C5XWT3_9BACT|nr:cobalamin B12-binding domain-containing protein [Posidoniimonas polymericola]TWT66971.1 Methylmalonyl-CoA mutase [Posidoniimonas polymericola]
MRATTTRRLLIGKLGLDGHDRGAKYVAQVLRDAGFEVIYTGIRRSPEQVVEAAIQEDVAGIGLSLLSGAHNTLFQRTLSLLHERHADDVVVFGGGTIPPKDVDGLKAMGVADVFTPGTPARAIVERINQALGAQETE